MAILRLNVSIFESSPGLGDEPKMIKRVKIKKVKSAEITIFLFFITANSLKSTVNVRQAGNYNKA